MNKKIIAAAHIAIDITPTFENGRGMERLNILQPGKLIQIGEANIHLGGSVSNTGLALHKLGCDVLLMAKIGDDAFGQMIQERIKKTKCKAQITMDPNESTSYTIIVAPPQVDRIFLHHAGSNETFRVEDVDFDKVAQYNHFHFGYPTLMKNLYQNDGAELCRLFKKVKDLGLTTSLDMASIDPDSEAGQCNWKRILERTLPYVDFFLPSIEELGYMLDSFLYTKWQKRAENEDITKHLSLSKDIQPLAQQTLALGCKALLIKCGVAGMYLQTREKEVMQKLGEEFVQWGDIEYFEKSFVPDRMCSATGAGDTSIAAFLKAALEGCSPYRAMQFATGMGASCVTAYDSLSGLLSFAEIEEKINNGWEKQNYMQS